MSNFISINRYITYDKDDTDKETVCVDGHHPFLDILSHGKPFRINGV